MVKIQAKANVPTEYGKFKIIAFSEKEQDWMPHLALIAENTDLSSVVNVRFHSESSQERFSILKNANADSSFPPQCSISKNTAA